MDRATGESILGPVRCRSVLRVVWAVLGALAMLAFCLVVAGCASDVKQRQAIGMQGVTAEGGLSNVTETAPERVRTGVNYPATSLSSNPEQFSSTGPGSQTTLFNQSFGTAMVAGVLKAQKVRALTQGNDEITVEGLEIDNTANAAPAWAKAIETQVVAMNQEQREIAKAQLAAQVEAIKATAPLAAQLIEKLITGL